MSVRTIAIFAIFALLSGAGAVCAAAADTSPSPSAAPVPAATPDVDARAKEWLHRLQIGDIDRSQLGDRLNATLTPGTIKQIVAKYGPLGEPKSFTYLVQQSENDEMEYVYRVVFKTVTIDEFFTLDKSGKITDIKLPPEQ